MAKDIETSASESKFILDALRQTNNMDGRKFDQFREVQLTFGEEFGDVMVQMGKTRVHCSINAEITRPYAR